MPESVVGRTGLAHVFGEALGAAVDAEGSPFGEVLGIAVDDVAKAARDFAAGDDRR